MKVKVLLADKFPDQYVQQLKDMNLEVIFSPKLGEKDLPEAAKEVDILVVRSTIVNAETISASKTLNLIIRAGAGVNNIDISASLLSLGSNQYIYQFYTGSSDITNITHSSWLASAIVKVEETNY